MIKTEIISVGRIKENYLNLACEEYKRRLSSYTKIIETNISEVKLPSNYSKKDIEAVLFKEGEKILEKINPSALKIILAIEGKQLSSIELSDYIKNQALFGKSHIQFIIGSSFGLDDRVKKAGDLRISFSKMTFPHQLMKVILYEQIYRSFSILNNSKYHK